MVGKFTPSTVCSGCNKGKATTRLVKVQLSLPGRGADWYWLCTDCHPEPQPAPADTVFMNTDDVTNEQTRV